MKTCERFKMHATHKKHTVIIMSALYAVVFGAALHAQILAALPEEIDELNAFQEIDVGVSDYRHDNGQNIIRSYSDFHIITDVTIDALYNTLSDRDAQAEILPRVLEYSWEPHPTAAVSDENREVVLGTRVVGIQFMGFDGTYRLRQRSELIDRRADSPKQVVLKYEMVESLDGKLESSSGAYLLQEITRDGNRYTYMRQQNQTVFRDTFFGLQAILRRFAPRDTERMFAALIEAARSRQAP